MLACLCLLAYLCSLLFPTTPRPHSPSSQNCPVSQAEGDAISFTKSFRLGYWLLGGGQVVENLSLPPPAHIPTSSAWPLSHLPTVPSAGVYEACDEAPKLKEIRQGAHYL